MQNPQGHLVHLHISLENLSVNIQERIVCCFDKMTVDSMQIEVESWGNEVSNINLGSCIQKEENFQNLVFRVHIGYLFGMHRLWKYTRNTYSVPGSLLETSRGYLVPLRHNLVNPLACLKGTQFLSN